MYNMNTECDLDDAEFIAVASTALQEAAFLKTSAASCSDEISRRVAP